MARASATLDEVAPPSRPTSRPAQQSALARIAGWCHDHRWWVLVIWLVALVASNVFAQTGRERVLQQPDRWQAAGPADPQRQLPEPSGKPSSGGGHHRNAIHRPGQSRPGRRGWSTPSAPCPTCPRWSARFSPAGRRPDLAERAYRLRASPVRRAGREPAHDRHQEGGQHGRVVRGTGLPGGDRGRGHRAGGRRQARARARESASSPPSSSCCWPSDRWWPWACPSSPPCSVSPSASPCSICLSHVVTTPVFAPEIMAMIGLGVGIDYALFVVTRYRQGLAERTGTPRGHRRVPGHVGPGGGVRRHHGHPLPARPLPPAAALHAGTGHRRHRRGGPGDDGGDHPAPGHDGFCRPGHRQAPRPRSAPERGRALGSRVLVPLEPHRAASPPGRRRSPPCSCWSASPCRSSR